MCGICGWLDAHSTSPELQRTTLERMNSALAHRGPDDVGFAVFDRAALAMSRLSILDLVTGHQPIPNEDETRWIVCNGELYNYLDLRPELERKGHIFRTRSDIEVILHAYEEWGLDCVRRFNGMFALAIWDERRKLLFLARDRIGEKPLYYYWDGQKLVFASEIKAVLADPTIPRQLNLSALANFLAYSHSMAPLTIYEKIYKLLPGHYLLAKEGDVRIVQYWDVGEEPQVPHSCALTEKEYAERILSLLDDSVRRRMIADVPVGAFLSGGVDSSAVVALMRRHTTGPIKTFSLGFGGSGAYDELSDARYVSEYLDTEHYELRIEHVDLVDTLRKLVYHYDEPFGDAAGFPVYLLSRFARKQAKVVLTGDGGDELFGGYRRYAADQVATSYQHLPRVLIDTWGPALVDRLPRLRRVKRAVHTLPISDPARRYAAWLVFFTPQMQAELLQPHILSAVLDHDPARPYLHYYNHPPTTSTEDHLNRLMYVDLKTWLVDGYMEKTDKATMASGLEARLPLLDYRLVELAFQIPGRYKIRGWSTKRVFKLAVNQLLPPMVMRKRKHGFAVPTDPWFRGELRDFTSKVLFDDRTRQRGYFNTSVVEQLWCQHAEGRHVWDTHLWLLLNFELWCRLYLDEESV